MLQTLAFLDVIITFTTCASWPYLFRNSPTEVFDWCLFASMTSFFIYEKTQFSVLSLFLTDPPVCFLDNQQRCQM